MNLDIEAPTRVAVEIAMAHGVVPDRCEVLQNGSTLVLRLSETLVARVVQDRDGPRQGMAWFARENAVAQHLARNGAPVIPMHPEIPAGPHEQDGYPVNFWQYVQRIGDEPGPEAVGRTMHQCHAALQGFTGELGNLGIVLETLTMLEGLRKRRMFPDETLNLLHGRLLSSLGGLAAYPRQPLHGDAHLGNLMNTTIGLLWTDWEDTFSGPVEWDLASIIWNARVLEDDHAFAGGILDAYRGAGGSIHEEAMHHAMIGRAAVMTAWYPVLYPDLSAERQEKLRRRIAWLEANG